MEVLSPASSMRLLVPAAWPVCFYFRGFIWLEALAHVECLPGKDLRVDDIKPPRLWTKMSPPKEDHRMLLSGPKQGSQQRLDLFIQIFL